MAGELVSILIATFNREALLPRCIRSALAQTYKNVKVMVYDDGSADGTSELVKQWPGVIYHRARKKRGVAYARNALLDMAEGQYGCWLDSDDLSNKYRVELLVQAVERWRAPFARSGFVVYDAKDQGQWKRPPAAGQPARHATATGLFRLDCAPRFDERYHYFGEDVQWEMEMTLAHGTGMLLPFALYLIGRGRHSRLSGALHMDEKRQGAESDQRLLAAEKKRLGNLIDQMGILYSCRIERLPPCALETSFPINRHDPKNMVLPQKFVRANLRSSQRWNGELADDGA